MRCSFPTVVRCSLLASREMTYALALPLTTSPHPLSGPLERNRHGAEKCQNKTAQEKATTTNRECSCSPPVHPVFSQMVCLYVTQFPLPACWRRRGMAQRREKVTRERTSRGEMKPTRGAFRAVLSIKTLALRLETCSFPFRKLPPSQGFAGWVSQGLCCCSWNPSAPDVPCGQMREAKVLIPWVAMSAQGCSRPCGMQ